MLQSIESEELAVGPTLGRAYWRLRAEVRHPRTLARRAHWDLLLQARHELKHGEAELHLIAKLADRGAAFVDVGANGGVYSCLAVPCFARVISVEPNPALAGPMSLALGPTAQVVTAALSDHSGSATLWMPIRAGSDVDTRASLQHDANPGFDLRPVEVAVMTLDSLGLEDIALLKVDVEGHELAALRGADATLARCRPVCIVESEERHNVGGVQAVMDFFGSRDYACWFLHSGVWVSGASFEVSRYQSASDIKNPASVKSDEYVNNFVFVPQERSADLRLRLGIG